MSRRHLDVVVPIYKNAPLVRACVDSLLAHWSEIADRQPRLILINDSPDDAAVGELLIEYTGHVDADIHVLTNAVNRGFVGTVNRGLTLTQRDGRDALLVNSDTLSFAGTMAQLLAATQADPQIAFACPRSNNASLCSLPHFHGGRPATPQTHHAMWQRLSRTMPAWHFSPTAVGFYMWIAHTVLADHGGLRQDFGLGYEEENDLVMRAGKLGHRAIIVNRAFAYHVGSASFSQTSLDLTSHRQDNHRKMVALHPEFMPLIRRYEGSAHFRAERLMAGLLDDGSGRLRVAFDLSGMGQHHNGTNEHTVALLRALVARWSHRLRIAGVCDEDVFRFHGLDRIAGLHREEPQAAGLHGVAIRLAQPFDMHHVNMVEDLAPLNVYAMLDTIAEDCTQLSAAGHFHDLWEHVACHANGLLFNSRLSERSFDVRYPQAAGRSRYTGLLSTRVSEYAKPPGAGHAAHVLVLGNKFPHKHSEVTAMRLGQLYPTLHFVALCGTTAARGNVTCLSSGGLSQDRVNALFVDASVIVLPSFMEGFGLGLMHALAAGKPIVARRIPVVEEILDTLQDVQGVFLYDNGMGLPRAFEAALQCEQSSVDDSLAPGWDDWADGTAELCLQLAERDDVFPRLVSRMKAADLLRRAQRDEHVAHSAVPAAAPATMSLETLLELDASAFVHGAYMLILRRAADNEGLAHYVRELQRGASKQEVLDALRGSDEARALSHELAEPIDVL